VNQSETAVQQTVCTECGRRIECCWCCEDDECGVPICYRCLARALQLQLAGPHEHGG
jgi:hypothetical protein